MAVLSQSRPSQMSSLFVLSAQLTDLAGALRSELERLAQGCGAVVQTASDCPNGAAMPSSGMALASRLCSAASQLSCASASGTCVTHRSHEITAASREDTGCKQGQVCACSPSSSSTDGIFTGLVCLPAGRKLEPLPTLLNQMQGREEQHLEEAAKRGAAVDAQPADVDATAGSADSLTEKTSLSTEPRCFGPSECQEGQEVPEFAEDPLPLPFTRSSSGLQSLGKLNASARSSILSRRRASFATAESSAPEPLSGQRSPGDAGVARAKEVFAWRAQRKNTRLVLWPALDSLKRASIEAPDEEDELDTVFSSCEQREAVIAGSARHSTMSHKQTLAKYVLQPLVMHPSSPKRISWVAFSTFFVMFDLVMVPLAVFEVGGTLWKAMDWARLLFWTIDFPVSFLAGFHSRTELEMRIQATAWKYTTTWMPFDLVMVLTDWLLRVEESMSEGDYNSLRALRLAKALGWMRILRTLRLLRVLKLTTVMRDLGVSALSGYTVLILGIFQQISSIMLINHWIACLWYWIGAHPGGWVSAYNLETSGGPTRYFAALHWSLTQFTPASMNIVPQNLSERIFAVSVLVFALITFSSFLSTITTLMTNLRNLNGSERAQLAKLEQYLHHHSIPFQLTVRIRRFADNLMAEERPKLEEQDVSLLGKLSTPLRRELQYEQRRPIVSWHPFFQRFANTHLSVVQQIYAEAIESVILCDGDVLFNLKDTAQGMYFLHVGVLAYRLMGPGKSRTSMKDHEEIEALNWFCEAALWTSWEHRGQMAAMTRARLLRVNTATFIDILTLNPIAARLAATYGAEAVKCVNDNEVDSLTDLDRTVIDSDWISRVVIAHATNVFSAGVPTPRFSFQLGAMPVNRISLHSGNISHGGRVSAIRGSAGTSEIPSGRGSWVTSLFSGWVSTRRSSSAQAGASSGTSWRASPAVPSRSS